MSSRAFFKRLAVACGLFLQMLLGSAQAYVPQSGFWIVDIENNGKPGRGFQFDVQNNVLALSWYGYASNGSPMWYLAAGPIVNNRFTGTLDTYRGGTAFGGAQSTAVVTGNAGTVIIDFDSGVTGTITLPGEAPKRISRFQFGYAEPPTGLLGQWIFSYEIGSVGYADTVHIKWTGAKAAATGTGIAYGYEGLNGELSWLISCEYQSTGTLAGYVVCGEADPTGAIRALYYFKYSIDVGKGFYAIKRDDGSWSQDYPMWAMRVGGPTKLTTLPFNQPSNQAAAVTRNAAVATRFELKALQAERMEASEAARERDSAFEAITQRLSEAVRRDRAALTK